MNTFTVYIPADEVHERVLGIAVGSAIVGTMGRPDPDLVQIDYEGNIRGAVNLHDFTQRLVVAAERHRDRAPTTARMWVPPEYLREIGTFDLASRTVAFGAVVRGQGGRIGGPAIMNALALEQWIGRYGT